MSRSHSRNPPEPSGDAPLVSAVIVNFNGWPEVERLVGALAGSGAVASGLAEIVVVDNGSDDGPPGGLYPGRTAPGVRVILRAENGGFAVGVNAGWHAARGRWLLLMNPDVAATGAAAGVCEVACISAARRALAGGS